MLLGIRIKVIVVPVAILLLAVTGLVLLVGARFRYDYSRSMQASMRVLADNLKLQMERLFELGFHLHDISGFDYQCREVLRQNPQLSQACIVDTSGKLLFSSHKSTAPTPGLPPLTAAAETDLNIVVDSERLEHYSLGAPIVDHYGKTVAWAVVAFPREVLDAPIRKLTIWLIGATSASGGLTAALLWVMLSVLVTRPILSLLNAVREIRTSGDLTREVTITSADEIGQLGTSFNAMIHSIRDRDEQIHRQLVALQRAHDELERRVQERTADLSRANEELQREIVRRQEAEAQREQMHANLLEASRKAGMADVATGVLHNVGNVLNSVNVATQVVHDRLQKSEIASLLMAVELIDKHTDALDRFFTEDERGRQLPAFLCKLARHLDEERSQLIGELTHLAQSVDHMKEIVGMQQSLAQVAGVMSDAQVKDIIEDAIRINQAGLTRHNVSVVREYGPELTIHTDRHKVLQILINLISNAKYALTHANCPQKTLALRVSRPDEHMLQITVSDNGVGIDPENMTKIFTYGFTTKKGGHGYGLHTSSLAAGELGGTLTAHSDGAGTGATFTLTLPIRAGAQDTCPRSKTTTSVG